MRWRIGWKEKGGEDEVEEMKGRKGWRR